MEEKIQLLLKEIIYELYSLKLEEILLDIPPKKKL
jgi:hypothetical protein